MPIGVAWVAVEPERGQVQVLVFGGVISPVFGVWSSAPGPAAPLMTSPPRLSAAPGPGDVEAPAAAGLSLLAWSCGCPRGLAPRRAQLGHRG